MFTLNLCPDGVLETLTTSGTPTSASDAYQVPEERQLADLASSLSAALSGDLASASRHATDAAYDLCADATTPSDLLLWNPIDRSQGQAQIALRPHTASPLILGTPHPNYDRDTLPEGIEIFQRTQARALIAAGTHRCASSGFSTCSGSTSVCTGSSEDYRESDQAHVVQSTFQRAHEVLIEAYPDHTVFSLHGMSRDGVSLSNGTVEPVTSDSPVARLATSLRTVFPGEAVTTCNPYDGADVDEHLCGTTNTQGRAVNESEDACESAATTASERFIHMEQSLSIRQSKAQVADAIANWLEG